MQSDGSWRSSKSGDAGWEKADFDDGKWTVAKVLCGYSKVGPWKGLVWDAGGDDRFSVRPGFKVESVFKEPLSLDNYSGDDIGHPGARENGTRTIVGLEMRSQAGGRGLQ